MNAADLQRFCVAMDDIRYGLSHPWTRDGYTWASDGHIIVRVPLRGGIPDNTNAPSALALFDKTEPAIEWMPVPEIAMPEEVACKWCNGTGKDCDDKRFKCEECGGKGKVPDPSGISFAGTSFAKRYLALIQGWEIAPNGFKAAWIRNDDALGLLMPMKL